MRKKGKEKEMDGMRKETQIKESQRKRKKRKRGKRNREIRTKKKERKTNSNNYFQTKIKNKIEDESMKEIYRKKTSKKNCLKIIKQKKYLRVRRLRRIYKRKEKC